eukprot:UN08329
MPNVFESQSEFTEWFGNPVNGMISRNQDLANSHIINRLHSVLKPFLLRRQKKDVEKAATTKALSRHRMPAFPTSTAAND